MGAWGPKLYQNDVALDVRDYYKDQLHRGKNGEEITQELIKEKEYIISDVDDAPSFWFALADTQWKLGRLENIVKEVALHHIDNGYDIRCWDAKEAKIRIKTVEDLRQKLLSPQPSKKKISQYKLYKCEWNLGDVFAYKLESDEAKERGLYGRYFLIQKVDEGIWCPGHIVPIVYVKLTKDEKLPSSKEEFDELEYVQVSCTRYDLMSQEFRPYNEDELTREEYWNEIELIKNNLPYDEYGYLQGYRMELITTSKRVIPKKLIYLGNFTETKLPKGEYILRNKISLPTKFWKHNGETIDTDIIKWYFAFTKKESQIYKNKQPNGKP